MWKRTSAPLFSSSFSRGSSRSEQRYHCSGEKKPGMVNTSPRWISRWSQWPTFRAAHWPAITVSLVWP